MCKIGGPELTEVWVGSGMIIENVEDESACRTQIKIKLNEPVDYFLKNSIANHHILILGDYMEIINLFFEFF
jgi:L-fucose isomerase-like protein